MCATIYDKLCLGCGEISPDGRGLFAAIEHSCPLNTVTYRPYIVLHGMGFKKMWDSLFASMYGKPKVDILKSLLTYEALPHFNPIQDSQWDISPLYEMLYSYARENEIKQMKRIRAWIDIEDEFEAKY